MSSFNQPMGNIMTISSPCFRPGTPRPSAVKLISYGGAARTLTGKHLAGEIMFESPELMVCPADSFFIGRPVPTLAIEDKLVRGQTYFLLPIDCLSALGKLSISSLMAIASDRKRAISGFKGSPFEYLKGGDGRVMIKVVPEFIVALMMKEETMMINGDDGENGSCYSPLCSTPELQKQYNQLVGSKDRINWSPKLDTISECKIRFSPCRFLGMEYKKQGIEG